MQTINIVHPNDPRGDQPLTVIVRKLNRIESIKRQIEIKKEERPYTDLTTGQQSWRVPGTSSDPRDSVFWYGSVKGVASGWINPPEGEDGKPAEFNADNLILLFDERFDIPEYVCSYLKDKDDKPINFGSVSFPFYIAMEWGNPERWVNPTQGGSKTT